MEKETKNKNPEFSLNAKLSLGFAISLLLASLFYRIYLFVSFVPLREHIDGKWSNIFDSFMIDTKQQKITMLNTGMEAPVRDYEIVKESRWSITLDVMGEIFEMNFDKNNPKRKTMMLSRDEAQPEEYAKILKGEKDPSIHDRIIDDPDEKLRNTNRKRRNGEI